MRCLSTCITFVAIFSTMLVGCTALPIPPADMVELAAVADPGQTVDVRGGNPDGTGAGVFTVPTGKVLVIQNVIVQPMDPGAGNLRVTFIQSAGGLPDRIRDTWVVPNTEPTHYDFSPGTRVSSESRMKIRSEAGNPGKVAVLLHGYVASTN